MQRTDRFDLRALFETSRLLSSSLDLEFVLDNLLLTAMSKLLVTRGVVLLHEPVDGLAVDDGDAVLGRVCDVEHVDGRVGPVG